MRYCPECGAEVVTQAKFCVECGQALGQAEPSAAPSRVRIGPAFAVVFAGILLIGLAAAYLLNRGRPQPNLPPGHPQVELPAEARKLLDDLRREAEAKPNDLDVWNRLGEATFRASMFDPEFLGKATEAYGHVLKLDPENPDALRGIGNINYDRGTYDQAIAAYEHYLKKRPKDPEVLVDLGTMYLYTGSADQAVVQYNKALAEKPDLFEAYFNLGVAYARLNDRPRSRASLDRALKLAPSDKERDRVKEVIARINAEAAPATGEPGVAGADSTGGSAAATTFEGEIEQMVRGLRNVGPKVKSIEWPSKLKVIVLLEEFPMDQMPPFAKKKFLTDIKIGIAKAKTQYKVDGAVELDLADSATRKTMESVTE